MLYLTPGTGVPERIYSVFIDNHEIRKVAHFLKKHTKPNYLE